METTLKQFTVAEPTIGKDLAVDGQAWRADCVRAQAFRLFDFPVSGIDDCNVVYRAQLKTEGLSGRAYLEMWCHFPGRGEFFSRDLAHALGGSNDWSTYETPFILQPGETPNLLRLNLVVAADSRLFWRKAVGGRVWIKDVTLTKVTSP